MKRAAYSLAICSVVLICCVTAGGMTQTSGGARRLVSVTNLVPKGAQPIQGNTVKVEVIDAVDLRKHLKVAIRVTSARKERVQGTLMLLFNGEKMDIMGIPIDLSPGETDLRIFSSRCGEGQGRTQLAKLTAELSQIRIGE